MSDWRAFGHGWYWRIKNILDKAKIFHMTAGVTWDVIIIIIHLVPPWKLPVATETHISLFNLLKSLPCLCLQSFFIVWMADTRASRRIIMGLWAHARDLDAHSNKSIKKMKRGENAYTLMHLFSSQMLMFRPTCQGQGNCLCGDIWALCLAICYFVPLFSFCLKITLKCSASGSFGPCLCGSLIKRIHHTVSKALVTPEVLGGNR